MPEKWQACVVYGVDFLNIIITTDETWLFLDDPDTEVHVHIIHVRCVYAAAARRKHRCYGKFIILLKGKFYGEIYFEPSNVSARD